LKEIFEKGQETIGTFNRIIAKTEDNEQYRAISVAKLKETLTEQEVNR
jgi:hypothetical protein